MDSSRPLANLVVIGAMKCGTTALHRYLDLHPDVSMAREKEVNFFIGPAHQRGQESGGGWHTGNWHRGLDWYADRFGPARVRGESSPGYTSPSFPEVAKRMAETVPDTRLVYLVRDPIDRALSQYRHHRSEGSERRGLEEALLDQNSQYLARSRFHARLQPFVDRFPRERILILAQEDLLHRRGQSLRLLYRFLGVEEDFRSPEQERLWHVGDQRPVAIPERLRRRLTTELADDAARLRATAERDFAGWSV